MKIKPVLVFPTNWAYFVLLMHLIRLSRTSENEVHVRNFSQSVKYENGSVTKLPVLYDSACIDAEMQNELIKSVLLAIGVAGMGELQLNLIDIAGFQTLSKFNTVEKAAQDILGNKRDVIVSLVEGEKLLKFAHVYATVAGKNLNVPRKLHIYTPRTFSSEIKFPDAVSVRSLQMSEGARALALLNRVRKVGIKTLIPILDNENSSQMEALKMYHVLGSNKYDKTLPVEFTKPIFLNNPVHTKKLKMILQEHSGFHSNHVNLHMVENPNVTRKTSRKENLGILLLARKSSQLALKIASEKNHLLLSWFSPNILEIEEWVHVQSSVSKDNEHSPINSRMNDSGMVQSINEGQEEFLSAWAAANNSLVGLYSVNFVGSTGWDNPHRRRVLRELASLAGASPRLLSTVLAYDAAFLAIDHLKDALHLPILGLSGKIDFNEKGFRKDGAFMGISSIPRTATTEVALLQPSTWILEDIISIDDTFAAPKITDYDVATSSILTKEELVAVANSTKDSIGCREHLMDIITYDPFSQTPYHYFFTDNSLPETIMVPNYQGFGITFVCSHQAEADTTTGEDEKVVSMTTMQLACTPGHKMNRPINCFRSQVNRRHKRAVPNTEDKLGSVPSVQYQYSFSGNDPWLSQSTSWASSKQDSQSQSYYQPNRDYQVESVTYGYPTTRLDVPIVEETHTTPAPGASKLPELRQILKAAKPFVGSCIGSSTGCAICVLVLGRLPLGNNPTACTGPCFVGTFGSCGALLGRVFAETTVICTELFKQGLLDVDTFVADAEFGNHLAETSPYTLKGYTLMATPLVDLMRTSKFVTDVVATFALPWAQHMKYLLGRSENTSLLGNIVHMVGYPLCNTVGRLYFLFVNVRNILCSSILLFSPLLTFILTLIYVLYCTNLGFSTNHKRLSLLECFLSVCTMLRFLQETLRKVYVHFKAIGRSM